MSNYEMEDSPAPDSKGEDSKKISFRFCRECSNMLYPKEDRLTNQLMFACRTCQFSEPATASCIWRNSLKEDVQETAGNVDDVAQDPTVGNSNDSSDYDDIMEDSTELEDVEGEDIVPGLCTLCGQEILCPICEKPTDGGTALEVDDPDRDANDTGDEAVEQEKRERESA
ncbi:uncharacterized protein MYCFIDRAFT_59918 [Pseudocercospora fijiensis CIRAD86]|uniref:DNA-directed RNA polymerase II subunit RPB9-like zinc ribbon domain-containing protein n=1 Tax=Pseudocercospora fijiensis (strain CIRAD86) TaxID=383855 RepID=M3B655_PSEFD|nr:uncharacterized protein MYCFIDRAFT_59918 [Pseudocercospora fijiensis CIRAD86]EME84813.1 hypothetical protein MYCFIDRAFT_59918 [Pseudocercospora fijiensis CIRAD86]